ncbi:MAG TPA: H-NS family nucleoid-associated regulatory protein [Acetobacteraceae bacterium]|nr:H-NS family nucleoid-associated regulatory protein [Acetobacteraceae bacterium]
MARSPNDLEQMSDGQLRELIQHARELLAWRIQERMDEFRMLAREAGFEVSLTKISEGGGRRRRRSTEGERAEDRRGAVAPKYRNPDNPRDVWSGRGRKPKWVEEKLSAGSSLEELAIAGADQAPA